ncbi:MULTISPECIES: DUF349 domain-containing protein [Lawsonella]|uniref:DUF349 domain-containing protein n=2 Tax=Bacteria TaxID=2 RepID=A0A2W5ICP7_9ACTN|nr:MULTISPECIES: DUF349 domain-containing protein [Lawsonella]PZP89851.1 MAG: DUF349 domain-containing protein [Lawsonella clevelandensis]
MSDTTPSPTPSSSHPIPGAGAAAPNPAQLRRRSSVVIPPRSQPEKWGHVDDDGSAWVKTADGERLIGTWQAGAPEEGLAHFGRRYDDLVTEVALLERRLDSHPAEAATTRKHAEDLKASLSTAAVIGDIAALDKRLQDIIAHSFTAEEKAKEQRQQKREAAVLRKTKLVEEAEAIGESATTWKQSGDRLREILEEWKTIHGIDRKTDDALWKRFSRARESFNRRRGSHFAELDRVRATAARQKEELVSQAESLQDSEEWSDTASEYRRLMQEWKKAGRAQKDVDDSLWARFKKAQDHFFDRRKAVLDERDSEFAANGAAKTELLNTYSPRIKNASDCEEARTLLNELEGKWEEIGRVPRADMRPLDDAIRSLERHVTDLEKAEWQRTDPEVQARAQQFWNRVKDFEAQAEKADKAGRTKDAEKARAQAAQWTEWAKAAENSLNEL